MTRRPKTRTERCSPDQGRTRIQDARKFLEVAELVDDEASAGVSAPLAVLAGIAAADAACCWALGMRSRGQDHNDAADLLQGVDGSTGAVLALRRLLSLKHDAQYGLVSVAAGNRRSSLRHARKLVSFAEEVIAR